jgi:spoIIIJ-associated protein
MPLRTSNDISTGGGLSMTSDVTRPIVQFLERFIAALGISATVDVEETDDGPRLNISGEEAELLVRHRGEPLRALQHVVDTAYGRALPSEKRVFVDALEYRKGKDIELRNMARFLAEKAKQTGVDQQLGPLNPYERRLVHISVAEVSGVTTESVGDAFSKTVLISLRK